jgi:hypothetical protein
VQDDTDKNLESLIQGSFNWSKIVESFTLIISLESQSETKYVGFSHLWDKVKEKQITPTFPQSE